MTTAEGSMMHRNKVSLATLLYRSSCVGIYMTGFIMPEALL
jgi:hypothetical protein